MLLYYLYERNLELEDLNQRMMIFWLNQKKSNLEDIGDYPCILYLKFFWYCGNQMQRDTFNQQNDENKILA